MPETKVVIVGLVKMHEHDLNYQFGCWFTCNCHLRSDGQVDVHLTLAAVMNLVEQGSQILVLAARYTVAFAPRFFSVLELSGAFSGVCSDSLRPGNLVEAA